jgi:hypothetical protein
MGEHSDVQLGQRGLGMDLSTTMRCLLSHLRVCEPWWLLLPTPGLVLGKMARWEALSQWFAYNYFNLLVTSKLLHMMKL